MPLRGRDTTRRFQGSVWLDLRRAADALAVTFRCALRLWIDMRLSSIMLVCALVACSHHDGNGTTDGNTNGDGDSGGNGDAGDGTGPRAFAANSLIIPMDLSYQANGMFQAYGLVYQLLSHNIHVYWLIDPNKTYHVDSCDAAADPCAWDCDVDGTGVKCAYPTSSPDFDATVNVIWDDMNVVARGTPLGSHAYRGGPFAVDSADY